MYYDEDDLGPFSDPDRWTPPSMVDGLKPGRRKVLFCAFKKNLVRGEIQVAEFSSYVSKESAYHHAEQCVSAIVIEMAQDFVGSNNISLFMPSGQFGTRSSGGLDSADAKYLYTRLARITRLIFPREDDVLLNYLSEDGKSVEPSWYMPIIPMGTLKKTCSEAAGVTYTTTGVIEEVDDTKLKVTELPIRCWTGDYDEFLESMCPISVMEEEKAEDKNKEPSFLEKYRSRSDRVSVEFEVILSEQNMNIAKKEGLQNKFNLKNTIGTSNMHLSDSDGKIQKYDTPEDMLKEFFKLRLEYYSRRKLLKPKNQVRFILAVNSGDIVFNNKKRAELFLELKQKGYKPFPEKKIAAKEPFPKKKVTAKEPFLKKKVKAKEVDEEDGYEYLLAMVIGTLTLEKVQELVARQKKLEDELESLGKATPEILWLRDLAALENELDASAPVIDDEDEALELKDRLAVYNFDDSSPEHNAMKTETKKGRNELSKRGTSKNAMAPLTDLSGDNKDSKFVVEEVQVEKKAGGRKPAAQKPKKTINRKRALAQSNSGDPSPGKKVRKMSDSNKENVSVLQRVASASTGAADAEPCPPSSSSAQPVAPRRSARLKQSTSID
ncbi:DNA topoisomerase 2-like [Triticum aestivum]|uniref:DNA topoisomerase (ATP-hydrolyzing) n=1 Tax=Aegilops tauschii TaxID=37682 RepID=M8B6G3_AEGTA|nr:DNA topoisomerase 2-like [Triticum aestivum]